MILLKNRFFLSKKIDSGASFRYPLLRGETRRISATTMGITAYIDRDSRLFIYNDGMCVISGWYHDRITNQRVQVNGNVVKVIGNDIGSDLPYAYCYRIEGCGVAEYWNENF